MRRVHRSSPPKIVAALPALSKISGTEWTAIKLLSEISREFELEIILESQSKGKISILTLINRGRRQMEEHQSVISTFWRSPRSIIFGKTNDGMRLYQSNLLLISVHEAFCSNSHPISPESGPLGSSRQEEPMNLAFGKHDKSQKLTKTHKWAGRSTSASDSLPFALGRSFLKWAGVTWWVSAWTKWTPHF